MKFLKILYAIILFICIGVTPMQVYANEKIQNTIIPKPNKCVFEGGINLIDINSNIYVLGKNDVETEELYNVGILLKEKLKQSTGYGFDIIKNEKPVSGSIYLTTIGSAVGLGNEGYNLKVSKDMVKINALKPEGVARGIQTLIQLFPKEIESLEVVSDTKWQLPICVMSDVPEYAYRGLMIDVARHFFPIDDIKRQIDLASSYKINKVHLHLSDDQGFRLEIKKWPKLTSIGGQTEVGGGIGGYYTQEHFKEIVNYAKERYIEIIPEFDMPGHSNAMLASYGFLNPDGKTKPLYTGTEVGLSSLMCRSEETYNFIEDIIKEVSDISPSKYIHIGGDEALSTSKEDYDYFVGRVSKIALKYGKTPIGWDPIDTAQGITSTTILQNWKDSNEQAKNKNMQMVISIAKKTYLDMKYNENTTLGGNWAGYNSVENAYNWSPTDFAPKNLILGIEAPLWTETIATRDEMDYMIYPRLLGYSEIGWTAKENRNWAEYKGRLKEHGKRMSLKGINYYKDPTIWNK